MKRLIPILILLLTACQPATPFPPITAPVGAEFILAPGQIAAIENSDLTITFVNVPNDARCPLKIECAVSGPVYVTINFQSGSAALVEFTFQTFTDNDGSVPEMDFEGMITRVEVDGYTIQIKHILPFPQKSVSEIGDTDYRAAFRVTK